ncbi:MAG: S8 family serine peptidase [Bacteroidia bacterium]|nr:S8 family serine peptidase [Bacteroidia bacterium]MDW8159340.1 S8 family serine peptidase [Bacteroidia bacterium]
MHTVESGRLKLRWAALLVLPLALLYRYIASEEQAVVVTLRDLGLAFLLTYLWERLNKRRATFFIVNGILVMAIALGWYLLSFAYSAFNNLLGEKQREPTVSTVQYLLELGPDDSIDEVVPWLKEAGASYTKIFTTVSLQEDENLAQYFLINCPADKGEKLAKLLGADKENVDSYEPNYQRWQVPVLEAHAVSKEQEHLTNDPFVSQQWALKSIQLSFDKLRALKPIRKARIAIIDTGVDKDHEDLEESFCPSPGSFDENGHGTHCAGIAGAVANNKLGIASLNWEGKFIEIMSFPALDAKGRGSVESVASAIIEAVQAGADVISLSLGGWHPKPPKAEVDAIHFALRKGCLVVVAAGNNSEAAIEFSPANVPGVIVVTALNEKNELAPFSNTVEGIPYAVAAPGVNILSLKPGNGYVALSGTSMATPLVAGILGVFKSINPSIQQKEAYEILAASSSWEQTETNRSGKIINMDKILDFLNKNKNIN